VHCTTSRFLGINSGKNRKNSRRHRKKTSREDVGMTHVEMEEGKQAVLAQGKKPSEQVVGGFMEGVCHHGTGHGR